MDLNIVYLINKVSNFPAFWENEVLLNAAYFNLLSLFY